MNKDVISVNSIDEERAYIQTQKCQCGGSYVKKIQSLLAMEQIDLITAECEKCRKEHDFYFDISSFYSA